MNTVGRCRSTGFARRRARGQSMTEVLLIGTFAAFTLMAMPVISEYGVKRMQTVSAARLLAWQRTVWTPTDTNVVSAREAAFGVGGSVKKSDEELTNDLVRHVFRNRTTPGMRIHDAGVAEFTGARPAIESNTTMVAKTTSAGLPSVLNATNAVTNAVRTAQSAVGGTDVTRSLNNFSFMSGGYFRNQVDVTHNIASFTLFPRASMSEQMTMLTEPWNAGGTLREEAKIQGLVPMKMLDFPFYQELRGGLHQIAYQVKAIFPTFDINNLLMGWTPGDAMERTPLDRFEQKPQGSGGSSSVTCPIEGGRSDMQCNKFRYYRAFPPTPVVNQLP